MTRASGRDVLVLPEAEVLGADAAFGGDGGGFGEDEGRAADGAAAEVDEMPVVGEAVLAGVFAHGRDDDAVGEGQGADGDGGEEAGGILGWHVWGLDVGGRVEGAERPRGGNWEREPGDREPDRSQERGESTAIREPRLAGEVSVGKKREASSRKRSLCGEPLNVGEG